MVGQSARRRRIVAPLGVLVLLLGMAMVVAACGDNGDDPTPAPTVAPADDGTPAPTPTSEPEATPEPEE